MPKAKKEAPDRGRVLINRGRYRVPVVCDILEDVLNNPAVPLSELARKHGITPGRIYHLMKEKTGAGRIGKLRQFERMQMARKLLYDGKRAAEASEACRYATVQAFSRAYKKYWGKPPLKWQKWAEEVKDPRIVLEVPDEKIVCLSSGDECKPFILEKLDYIPLGWDEQKMVKKRQKKVNFRHKMVNPEP